MEEYERFLSRLYGGEQDTNKVRLLSCAYGRDFYVFYLKIFLSGNPLILLGEFASRKILVKILVRLLQDLVHREKRGLLMERALAVYG